MARFPRSLTFALFLLSTTPAFAQSGLDVRDFSVEMEAAIEGPRPADRIAAGYTVYYLVRYAGVSTIEAANVSLEVDVPGTIVAVLEHGQLTCTRTNPVQCTFRHGVDPNGGLMEIAVRIDEPGTHTATARIIATTPDANPANDIATHSTEAVALPSLALNTVVWFEELGANQPAFFSVWTQNRGSTPATAVTFKLSLLAGGTITRVTADIGAGTCTVSGAEAVCRLDRLTFDQYSQFRFEFTAPDRGDGRPFLAKVELSSAEEDFDPSDNATTISVPMIRQFVVANTNDEGSGSLRQAILDASAACGPRIPCSIAFRIPAPVPESGWFTIRPRSPLPAVEGDITVDGATQTAFTGDTNPDGPEIEINGALVQEGSGLLVRPNCEGDVFGLAVNGFPGYGIEVNRFPGARDDDPCWSSLGSTIAHNYLGTDPRGRVAVPNQRGVGLFTFIAVVEDNLIRGNTRAGIFARNGFYARIARNRIVENGASGIFFDMGDPWYGITGGADVTKNVIAHNDHWAIARTRRGEIDISDNAMYGNRHQAIDIDLDLETPNRPNDTDAPNRPVLFDAFFDPATQSTIVRGRLDSTGPSPWSNFTIEIYASANVSLTNGSEAEQMVATQRLTSGHTDFEIAIPMDLRGKWITALNLVRHVIGLAKPGDVATHSHFSSIPGNTSELSNAIRAR